MAVANAFIWDSARGMRDVKALLEDDFGFDLTDWHLKEAVGVSYDGLTIIGNGINPAGQDEAWIAQVPEPGTLSLLMAGVLLMSRRRHRSV